MNWRQAVGTVSQRRVKKAMGEALDCLQYTGGCTLEKVLEVYFPSNFPKLLSVADLGLSVVWKLTSRLGRLGCGAHCLQVSLWSAGSVTVCNACWPSRVHHFREAQSLLSLLICLNSCLHLTTGDATMILY